MANISLYPPMIYNNGIAYKILDIINVHHFFNSDQSINKKVLGLYVHEKQGDHVLQQGNQFIICETIEEIQIL